MRLGPVCAHTWSALITVPVATPARVTDSSGCWQGNPVTGNTSQSFYWMSTPGWCLFIRTYCTGFHLTCDEKWIYDFYVSLGIFFFNNSGSRFLVSLSLSIITRLPFVDNLIMVIVKVLASTWRTFSLVQRCSHKWGFCIFPGPSCGPWLPLMVLFHISSLTECRPFKSLRQTK